MPDYTQSSNGHVAANEAINLRSSEIDEVLSQPPVWLVRWGISVFFLGLLILVAVGWFVKYPDLISGSMRIVGDEFPKSVNAKSDGKLVKLFSKEGDLVQKGQYLAFLESTANPDEILQMESVVDSLVKCSQRNDLAKMYALPMPFYFQLGELQKSFQTFQDSYVRAKSLLRDGAFDQKRMALDNDLTQLSILESNLNTQVINHKSDLELSEADLLMNRKLHQQKVIADVEMRRAQSFFIAKKQIFDQAQTNFNNNGMAQNQKRQELLELEKTRTELRNGLLQAINTLKSDIESWKQRFVATAPANGKVSFLVPLQEGQTVKTGQELFYVMPQAAGFHGEMYVGQYNFGKIRQQQEVIVKLPSYPFQEFGTVIGKVTAISELPKDSTYLVKISFPAGLVTSSKKQLPFKNGMTATGEIVTEDLRLIERLFYNFRRMLKR
ncbi:MAG: HlyD family efflux transporter periplasmic adaptor subunit [Runella slithyformis]|nr:MAG: HlyD family efflux transporter periplasmic adaptor subunit [Runella slithyformis]TAE94522.1 MAG: HlyD family efflux transporter periplasmic adaptor subunit [Runella slithyformis]TAF29205.1 MAG: HlyD family efflux transporter periplasmic adaptor subunit [Runella slithyformis]TAF48069.1 MAG: HlyD family efflux transporter periplasmic adaptor subunit [Runella slithyformis]TAF82860.1 MAG: HlyD family efflux transporter periplasmic adaptor subunit [Runella slithyformis]